MVHSPWKLFVLDRHTPGEQRSRRRRQMVLRVECVALDRRRLLSNVVPAASEFSVPPAGVVANAAAILESRPQSVRPVPSRPGAGRAAVACQPSRCGRTRSRRGGCRQDLEAAGASGLNDVQDSGSITRSPMGLLGYETCRRNLVPLSQVSPRIDKSVEGAPAVFDASGAAGSISPINQLVNQIKVVAKLARVTPAGSVCPESQLYGPQQGLGSNPYVSLGPARQYSRSSRGVL